jgi:hypothetical protein
MQLITLAAGGFLLAMMGWSVFHLPVLVQAVVLLSILAMVLFFTKPEVSLLVFFALRALFDLLWWIPGTIASMNMMELYTGAVTAMATMLFAMDVRRFDRHPCLPAFTVYGIVLAIGGLRSMEFRAGAEILARYASPLIIMFLVSTYFDTRERRIRLFKVATAVCIIPVVLSIYHLATGQMNTYTLAGYNRLLGAYKNLHNHALMMMFIVTMSTWWWFQTRQRSHKFLLFVYGGMAAIAMTMTYVRTAQLALLVFLFIFLYLTYRRRYLGVALLVVVLLALLNPTVQDRFKDLILILNPDDETMLRRKIGSGRWGLWTSSFSEFLRYPLGDIILGLGVGGHWVLTRGYFNPYSIAQQGYVDPHSDYLTMTYQVGPIATLAYLALQMQVIRYALRIRQYSPDGWARHFGSYMVALCVAATVANCISNAFINRTTLGWYFWGLAGLVFAEHQHLVRSGRVEGKFQPDPVKRTSTRPAMFKLRGPTPDPEDSDPAPPGPY